ncbi:MAG TPA: glycosyltransferase family 1 protein [Acidimicrobiales bacterium]|nr:glycosyltransferase family 1 protein [Acidimicrobiales bacterium]
MIPPTPVVLDAQSLSSVAAGGGIGSYTRHLLAALAHRDDVSVSALCAPSVSLPDGVTPLPMHRLFSHPRLEVMEHAARLPRELRRLRPGDSVFHNPSFHAPAGVDGPWVQTLLDVIPLVLDEPDHAVLRARWKRFGPRYRKADAVIAISQHAADEGTRLLGLEAGKVHVARLGVDPSYRPGVVVSADPPYLLVVSEYSRRKGFAEAFAVLDALADTGYPHRLLVAGRIHPWARAELAALHAAARHPERIEVLDFVPDLVALYQGASAFLMCSRYEGFGLPALEAMACGVPVVAFANSAVTEMVSGGGHLVANGDVVAMTDAVSRLLSTPALALEWREKGMERARWFTWERTAASHAEVYAAVAGGRS